MGNWKIYLNDLKIYQIICDAVKEVLGGKFIAQKC